jgi:hypothetical protein
MQTQKQMTQLMAVYRNFASTVNAWSSKTKFVENGIVSNWNTNKQIGKRGVRILVSVTVIKNNWMTKRLYH